MNKTMKNRIFIIVIIILSFNYIAIAQWQQLPGPYGGEILCISSNNNKLYAGTNGSGLFVSCDYGQSWTSISNGLHSYVNSLLFSGSEIYAGCTNEAFVSSDYGQSWTLLNNGITGNGHEVSAIVQIGTDILIGNYGSGVFKSSNNGQSWSAMNSGLTSLWVTCMVVIGSDVYVGTTSGGIFKSTNSGQTWTAINNGLTNNYIYSLISNGTDLYAGTSLAGVFRSVDGGQNWTSITNGVNLNGARALMFYGNNLYVGTMWNGIYVSSNFGVTWSSMNNGLTYTNVNTLFNDGTFFYAGTMYSGVYKSVDYGQNWFSASTGINVSRINDFDVNNSGIYVGTSCGFNFSSDAGQTWSLCDSGISYHEINTLKLSGTEAYAGTNGGHIYKTINNGQNWVCLNTGVSNMVLILDLAIDGPNIFAADYSHGIFRSTDNGQTWSPCNNGMNLDNVYCVAVMNAMVFAGGFDGIYRSSDNGTSWTVSNTGLDSPCAIKSFINLGNSIFAGGRGKVYRSINNGQSWTISSNGLPANKFITSFEVYGSYIFAGSEGGAGLYLSSDNGLTWMPANSGLPVISVSSLRINNFNLFVGTGSGYIFHRPVTELISSSLCVGLLSSNIICYGTAGIIDITINGGISPFTYSWSNGETTEDIGNLSAGNYDVTVTDSLGTIATSTISLSQSSAIQLNFATSYCSGSINPCAFSLSVSGGTPPYSYLWSNNASTQNLPILTGGTYSVTVFDSNGCLETGSITLDSLYIPSWSFTYTDNSSTILIPVNSALTINGSPLQNYEYIGVFYESAGQFYCGGYIIWHGTVTALTAVGDDPLTPFKEGFSVGEPYIWKVFDPFTNTEYFCNPSYDPTFPDQGYYVINGFSSLLSLNNQTLPLIVNNFSNNVTCNNFNDGSIMLTVTGGQPPYYFQWSNGDSVSSISGLAAGTYNLTVYDYLGSSATQSFQITQPPPLLASISISGLDTLTAYCSGGTPSLSYLWSTGDSVPYIIATVSGNYSVTITDNNGCNASASYPYTQTFSINGQVSGYQKNTVNCAVLLINKPVSQHCNAIQYMVSTDGIYSFDGLSEGIYYIYAIPNPSDGNANLPSYYGNKLHWNDASFFVNLNSDLSGVNINLVHYTPAAAGTGSISGHIYYDSDNIYETSIYENNWFGSLPGFSVKSNAAMNIPVILLDENLIPVGFTLSDDNGYFYFDQLVMGNYYLYSEKAGLVTIPVEIELYDANPQIDNIIINITASGITGIYFLPEMEMSLRVYPIPANDKVFIEIQLNKPDWYNIDFINYLGTRLYSIHEYFNSGLNLISLPVSSYPDGLYNMQIVSNKGLIGNETFLIVR